MRQHCCFISSAATVFSKIVCFSFHSHEHIELLSVNQEILFFRQRDGDYFPSLRLLHKCKADIDYSTWALLVFTLVYQKIGITVLLHPKFLVSFPRNIPFPKTMKLQIRGFPA